MGMIYMIGSGSGIDLDAITAISSDMLKGKQSIDKNGNIITGTIESQGEITIIPSESAQSAGVSGKYMTGDVKVNAISKTYVGSGVTKKAAATIYATTSDQTIAANQYLTGIQTISKITSTNFIAANVKTGVVIKVNNGNTDVLSVTGSFCSDATLDNAANLVSGVIAYGKNGTKYTGTLATLAGGTYTPTAATQTISCSGKKMTSNVVISALSNLTAGNIKKGVTIAGITGTFQGWVSSTVYIIQNYNFQNCKASYYYGAPSVTSGGAMTNGLGWYWYNYGSVNVKFVYKKLCMNAKKPKSITIQVGKWEVWGGSTQVCKFYFRAVTEAQVNAAVSGATDVRTTGLSLGNSANVTESALSTTYTFTSTNTSNMQSGYDYLMIYALGSSSTSGVANVSNVYVTY